jgi:antitoxin HicB
MNDAEFGYPARLAPDDGGFVVTFPDIPQVHTFGDDKADALGHALDALETGIGALMDLGADIPRPSPARGRPVVMLPPLSAAKVALYRAMRAKRTTNAELARRLKCHPPQVDRLLDLRHASRLDQIDKALRVLGKRLVVEVRSAA